MMTRLWKSLGLGLALAATTLAFAQTPPYPGKPVRIIVASTPGGPVDITARLFAQKLGESWGQQVVVENRPGGSGMIAAEYVAKSPADGYTLLASASVHVIVPSLYPKMAYDPIRDFSPITVASSAPLLLVIAPTLPVKNLKEFVALAKAHPTELSFGSGGNGSSTHLIAELMNSEMGIKTTHVPYKGQSQALTDVISGQIPFMFNSVNAVIEFLRSGRLRALAITADKRSEQLPTVPTFLEAGYKGLVTGSWYAFWAPAKTPEAIVAKLNAEMVRIVNLPDIRNRLVSMGADPVGNTFAEFDAFQKIEAARWAKVVKVSGAKAE